MDDKCMRVLVTGGAGYIGSHTCVELVEDGFEVVVIDNLSNSSKESLNRVQKITGKRIEFVEGDIRDKGFLMEFLSSNTFSAVIHFAGLKAVGESVEFPLSYYENNVAGTINLLQAMNVVGLKSLVFSSSATVYGDPNILPIPESSPLSATNPYGQSKLMIENMLRDLCISDADWKVANLRYFNPVGAHISGFIGEDPRGIPNNLMPFISQVAIGVRDKLNIFGGDYSTIDGTGVRDYIHVVDLAKGHLAALNFLFNSSKGGFSAFNLGTGQGASVLELVKAFESANQCKVPYTITSRRSGDITACYADVNLAKEILGWQAEFGIERMCKDVWRWQTNNPNGYNN